MKVVQFNCPEIESLSGFRFIGFPNPDYELTKLFKFIAKNPGCSRDTLFDNFSGVGCLMWLRNNGLLDNSMASSGKYKLTPEGIEVLKFIDWLEPVYEVIDLASHIGPQNFDELDVGATMVGRHDLVEEKVATRLEMIRRWNNGNLTDDNANLRGMKRWMSEVLSIMETTLITACSPDHELYDLFKEKYSLDFS